MWTSIKKLFGRSESEEPTDTPIVVATCNGPIEANMILSQLHDSGIPAALLGADSASVFGMQTGILAEVRIVVPALYAGAAQELLGELDLRDDMTLEGADGAEADANESDNYDQEKDNLKS
ncbi:MAG: hypothetical protein DWI54_06220 [Chloroflexi bacterium]|nr:MAG: hypothetical protein DWI54_06220 [Chloroflexota bacterium]